MLAVNIEGKTYGSQTVRKHTGKRHDRTNSTMWYFTCACSPDVIQEGALRAIIVRTGCGGTCPYETTRTRRALVSP